MRILSDLIKPSIFTGVLAVFTGLVGFYITNVVESLRSGYTAIHYFESEMATETVVFHLINVSRTKRIEAASFVIKCSDQSTDCFGMIQGSSPASLMSEITTVPNFGRQIDGGQSGPAAIRVCLGAIASSRTSIRVAPKDGAAEPLMVLYDPWSEDCRPTDLEATNLLLLGPSDPHAFFVQHYFTLITVALAVSAAILAMTGVGILARRYLKEKEDSDVPVVQGKEVVFLSYRIGGSDDRSR